MVAHFNFISVSACMLLAAQSAIATPTPASTFLPGSILSGNLLSTRQNAGLDASDIPSQCQSQCAGLLKLQDCGTDEKCICNDGAADSLASCINCAASLNNSTTSRGQAAMDAYVEGCKQAGITVKSENIDGKNGAMGMRPELLGIASIAAGTIVLFL